MIPSFLNENDALAWSWNRHPHDHLANYLVKGVEDPRINCQSILSRALIIDTLWPGKYSAWIDEELRFGTVLTWILKQLENGKNREDLSANVIQEQSPEIPEFVLSAYQGLQNPECIIPDYITEALSPRTAVLEKELPTSALDVFTTLWSCELHDQENKGFRLLEPACGSANDYRFFHAFGLASFVQYAGFDISQKNVENASRLFPDIDFKVLSLFDSGLEDRSCDLVMIHDLFEHLSPEGMERALKETIRVCERQIWIHFFNLSDIPEHHFKKTENYHWNQLSLDRILEFLKPYSSDIEVICIPEMLKNKFGFDDYHNQQAVTLIVSMD